MKDANKINNLRSNFISMNFSKKNSKDNIVNFEYLRKNFYEKRFVI